MQLPPKKEILTTSIDSLAVIFNPAMDGSTQRTPWQAIQSSMSPALCAHGLGPLGWCLSCAAPPLLLVGQGGSEMRWWWDQGLAGWGAKVTLWPRSTRLPGSWCSLWAESGMENL